jgi:hypothetical protein
MTAATKTTEKPATKTTAEQATSDAETMALADAITAERKVETTKAPAKAKAKEMTAKTKAVLKFVTSTEGHHSVSAVRKGVTAVKWDRETRDALRRLTAAGLIQTGKDAGVEVFYSK